MTGSIAKLTMHSITIYRNRNGEVEKEAVAQAPVGGLTEGVSYHEQIIKAYSELENQGKLQDMSPKSKRFVRDLHTYAQDRGYWYSDSFGYKGEGE
jgi:hypothetical protein